MRVVSDDKFERAIRSVRLALVASLTLGLASIVWFVVSQMKPAESAKRLDVQKER